MSAVAKAKQVKIAKPALPKKEKNRVAIPQKTLYELWAKAGGRCEFRGCNKVLYLDELTKVRDNLALVSHIVGAEEDGPRGDAVESKRLVKDISNLMLTCREHGKIIDTKEYEDRYTVELLCQHKKEHEDRINLLTGIQEDAKTHVIIFQVPIAGMPFGIEDSLVFQAILPKYPAEKDSLRIDLSNVSVKETKEGFWNFLSSVLCDEFHAIFKNHGKHFPHVSVFALAPIPLLVQLGSLLGDKRIVDLYQRHRTTGDWKWKDHPEELHEQFYEVRGPDQHDAEANTAIILSISGQILRSQITDILGANCNCYAVSALRPGLDFLSTRNKLNLFGYEFRALLETIRRSNGHGKPIHLFCAVPAPVAVECGRALLPKSDPHIIVYDYIKEAGGFQAALQINDCK